MTAEPIIEMHAVVKNYNALRPLRIADLSIASAARVATLRFPVTTESRMPCSAVKKNQTP